MTVVFFKNSLEIIHYTFENVLRKGQDQFHVTNTKYFF